MEVVKMHFFSVLNGRGYFWILSGTESLYVAIMFLGLNFRFFLIWLQRLIDPLSIYFHAINRTNSSSSWAVVHLYTVTFHIMYQNIISIAHLTVFLSREGKWGQLFNASCVLVVFVTPVCSNKPCYSMRRAQQWWRRDGPQLDYTTFL